VFYLVGDGCWLVILTGFRSLRRGLGIGKGLGEWPFEKTRGCGIKTRGMVLAASEGRSEGIATKEN